MEKLMLRYFPPRVLVTLIFTIFFLQVAATYWHLFFYIWWLDIPMHILGGLWIALFALASYYGSLAIKEKEYSQLFVTIFAVAMTLSIGLFWEIYEFGVDHAVGDTEVGLADALMDLTNDLVGALLAAWLFVRFGYNKKL